MKPIRPEALLLPVGTCFILFLCFFSALLAGCTSGGAGVREFALPESDARKAGALALYAKGLLLESQEDGDTNASKRAACEAFQQAVRLDPDNPQPLAALVSNLADRERFSEALVPLEAYLRRHPADGEMRIEAARMADAAERPADAARHCAVLLDAQPDNRELAQALIRLYFQSDQPRLALDAIRSQQARFNDKTSLALPIHWAIHFTREGDQPRLALDCLDLAMRQRTNAADRAAILTLASESQLQQGQTNAAMATLSRAYRENPAVTTPLLRLGALWAETPGSTNLLQRQAARERDPDTTLQVLAATHQALDQTDAAIAVLKDVYARRMRAGFFPDEGFYLWYGALLEHAKDYGAAERLFQDALAAHPDAHEIKNFLAYMWAEQGKRLDAADRLINEALRAEPENAAYLDTKGWVLFKGARFFDAIQFLLKAAELEKEEPVILDHTGDALKAVGRESEAVAFWTRSHQIEAQPAVAEKLRKHGVPTP